MTVKGQVTIPKDVRNALGLRPGEPVAFERDERGNYLIRKPETDPAEYQRRCTEALAAIREVRRKYPMNPLGMTTDEYMALIREPVPDPGDL